MKAPEPKEIRECFADFLTEWEEVQEEGKVDMRFVAGDPWEAKDRKAREDAGRPCISLDELNQYLNQAINNIRENKRAIQVIPKGDGSNDQDAERRANIIRGIEYHSQAQSAYITAFENALQRGYGFAGIQTDYESDQSFDQEIRIRRFPNPDCVLIDPKYQKADASDIQKAFVTDLIRKSEFKRKYKNAKPVSFDGENLREAHVGDWIRENFVQLAEFWQVEKIRRKLLLIDGGEQGPIVEFEDELRNGLQGLRILKARDAETAKVMQYITNGLEILEDHEWAGSRIPIAACFGKEIYVDDGDGAKRMLLSMVRLARDAQMLLAFLATGECEIAGKVPKVPFVGAKGQFESDQEAWEFLNKIPRAYVQYDPIPDPANPTASLPAPVYNNFTPDFQEWEVAKDSARRSIQAAMGISPLPTAAQRANAKSGVALEKIQTQEAIGSFHFTDNFDNFIANIGWQVNELIDTVYDTPRTLPITKKDGTHSVIRINDPAYAEQNQDKEHLLIKDENGDTPGNYGATVSTGPSYQSQREEASEFVDLLLENVQQLPIPPQVATKILAQGIRLKDIGPIGDKIAELLDPPDENNLPPAAQAIIAQLQGQLAQLQQEDAALHMERSGKVLEQQTKLIIEQMKSDSQQRMNQLSNDIKVLIAEISAKAQDSAERVQMYKEFWLENHGAAHDVGMQATEHEHAQALAQQQATLAAQTQASDQLHQQTMAAQQPASPGQ
jgi:hypothetical protein